MASSHSQQRTPLKGSCHCGFVQFVVFLNLPHKIRPDLDSGDPHQRVYRCNCTICHKLAQFHVHTENPTQDFYLLSPLDPLKELGDYTWKDGTTHFLFCKTCGVTPFLFHGEGKVIEVPRRELWKTEPEHIKIKVWKPTGENVYCSINGHAIDAEQPFDMRELTEKKLVQYLPGFEDPYDLEGQYERPGKNGSY